MSVLPIVTYNDPILRKHAEPITDLNDDLKKLINNMFETMYNSNGVGLAAPQIGKSIRLFVIDPGKTNDENAVDFEPTAFINPVLVAKKGPRVPLEEGCLSIPNIVENVFRPETVIVRFHNQNFEEQELEVSGWVSRIIQHENDHLNGRLFIDYLSPFKKVMIKTDLESIDNGSMEVEYPIAPKL